jgi:hypothetical protein
MQKEKGRNPLLSYKERYWDTTHRVYEDVGTGPQNININFRNPGDLGFDVSKIGTPACSTIVCANGIMCHFVRPIEGGVELRTRFWMGYAVKNRKLIKTIPDGVKMPDFPLRALNLHNIKEFTNLAALLPRIYPEERDNF